MVQAVRGILIACSLSLFAPTVGGQEKVLVCASVELRSIAVSTDTSAGWPLDIVPGIQVVQQKPTVPGAEGAVSVIALGPILDSNDSKEVKTDVTCTAEGFRLELTIARFVDGDALKNVLWRPKIDLSVFLRQPAVVLQAVWKMRTTNRKELRRARTPPYPEQKYPITVTETLRISSYDK